MHRHLSVWLSLLIGFLFVSFIWQIAESELVEFVGIACYRTIKHSFIEVVTHDADGIPMRYYPGIGTVYDPELVATEASRNYDTRIEPSREKRFLQLSQWLVTQVDSTGMIPHIYDYPAAGLTKPWYSASTQSAAMLAIAQRAGFLRKRDLLLTASAMLSKLEPQNGFMGRAVNDSTIWYDSYPGYALGGMVSTLLNLHKYHKLVGDPRALDLFDNGARMLSIKLPNMDKNGFLDDRYTRMGKRQEHRRLISLLEELSKIYPNPQLSTDIMRYKRMDKHLVIYQLLEKTAWGRLLGFLLIWLLLSLIIHGFLRVPK